MKEKEEEGEPQEGQGRSDVGRRFSKREKRARSSRCLILGKRLQMFKKSLIIIVCRGGAWNPHAQRRKRKGSWRAKALPLFL
ncbi:MAG: hypothetical protein HFH94_12370 [Lachnospiraceae bacterium]|nr:hypothetical protein [uncultured Acetatifactor sp.]MCI9220511.1 hypothetical protein [Lachnospiraceae bacterium]